VAHSTRIAGLPCGDLRVPQGRSRTIGNGMSSLELLNSSTLSVCRESWYLIHLIHAEAVSAQFSASGEARTAENAAWLRRECTVSSRFSTAVTHSNPFPFCRKPSQTPRRCNSTPARKQETVGVAQHGESSCFRKSRLIAGEGCPARASDLRLCLCYLSTKDFVSRDFAAPAYPSNSRRIQAQRSIFCSHFCG
jgi:hypothetical protein